MFRPQRYYNFLKCARFYIKKLILFLHLAIAIAIVYYCVQAEVFTT